MKKLFTLIIALVVSYTTFAQDENNNDDVLKNKKGEVILPQAGDYAIGVSATPFINLVGNLIKINSAAPFTNPLSWNFVDPLNTIFGKYYLTDNTAIRASIRFGMGTTTYKNYVTDQTDNTGQKTVLDKMTQKQTNIILSAGIEKRRGHGRLQAFYGAGAYLGFLGSSQKFIYGNEMNSIYTTPLSTTNWTTSPYTTANTNIRPLSIKNGKTIMFGLRSFVGVEYFIMPKVSLGGEFGYGLGLNMQGDGTQVNENYNFTNSSVETIETKTGGKFSLGLDNDNYGGTIYLLFHF